MTLWWIDLKQWDGLGVHGCKPQTARAVGDLDRCSSGSREKRWMSDMRWRWYQWNTEGGRRKHCLLPAPDKPLCTGVKGARYRPQSAQVHPQGLAQDHACLPPLDKDTYGKVHYGVSENKKEASLIKGRWSKHKQGCCGYVWWWK